MTYNPGELRNTRKNSKCDGSSVQCPILSIRVQRAAQKQISIFCPLSYNLLCTTTKGFSLLDWVVFGRVKLSIIYPGAVVFVPRSEYLAHTWWYCRNVQNNLCKRLLPNNLSNIKRILVNYLISISLEIIRKPTFSDDYSMNSC